MKKMDIQDVWDVCYMINVSNIMLRKRLDSFWNIVQHNNARLQNGG